MPREIFTDVEQGTPEWHALRCGIPTASEFAKLLAKGKGGGSSVTRREYLYRLAGEIVTGQPGAVWAGNAHTDRGHEQEPHARLAYEIERGVDVQRIGFIRNGRKGCSPDGAVEGDPEGAGGVEIKSKLAHIAIAALLRDDPPPEHKPQVQGILWVAEWEWIDLTIYCPGLPLIVHRERRDEKYILDLVAAHAAFIAELDEIVSRVRAYGEAA